MTLHRSAFALGQLVGDGLLPEQIVVDGLNIALACLSTAAGGTAVVAVRTGAVRHMLPVSSPSRNTPNCARSRRSTMWHRARSAGQQNSRLLGPCDVEFAAGKWLRCNDWLMDLRNQITADPQAEPTPINRV